MPVKEKVEEPKYPFSKLDRCDKCGARAYVRALHVKSDTDLLFCVHHYRAFEPNLVAAKGWLFDDQTDVLEEEVRLYNKPPADDK